MRYFEGRLRVIGELMLVAPSLAREALRDLLAEMERQTHRPILVQQDPPDGPENPFPPREATSITRTID